MTCGLPSDYSRAPCPESHPDAGGSDKVMHQYVCSHLIETSVPARTADTSPEVVHTCPKFNARDFTQDNKTQLTRKLKALRHYCFIFPKNES